MTTSTTAATTTPEAKAPSKMQRCETLYEEVFAPGYDLGGKSQRAVFIARAIAEVGMSQAGANTYYQNLSNASRGKGKYKYNKYQSKAGSKADSAGKTEAKGSEGGVDLPGSNVTKGAIAAAEKQAVKTTADLTKRWQVKDGEGNVVNSFDTRSAAKSAATDGLTWHDAQAK